MRRLRLARRIGGDTGTAAVEFALLAPVLLLITFGIIDFGRALHSQLEITNAARAGARVDALGQSFDTVFHVMSQASPGLPSRLVTIVNCVPGGEDNGQDATVKVDQPFTFVTPIGAFAKLFGGSGWSSSLTLTSTATLPCET